MQKHADLPQAGAIPPATRKAIAACLRQGLSLRKTVAETGAPFSWVRRVHALLNDVGTTHSKRQPPEDPTHDEIVQHETDGEMAYEELVAINAAVLADLEREFGSPENCPSLAEAREPPEEFLPFRRMLPANVTALVLGDPPPGWSALCLRAG
ncbi:hypothetical protein [Microvirga arsenatis]|uniref:Uncharacterized protein n=1 Tax=Microvirga arsenatis TaxID=2692265 RepID=A0ABW9YY72_9HYPH|nr:hypothetical protein [Microvirga arsenatis]NBJ13222.1 hypothetical protein [Microvirga arsenatis]NBJ25140.1 hypothetical protein [Microvirga arsenatis]